MKVTFNITPLELRSIKVCLAADAAGEFYDAVYGLRRDYFLRKVLGRAELPLSPNIRAAQQHRPTGKKGAHK